MPWLSRQCATTTSSSSSTTSSSLDDAAAQTIAMLRQHPGLLKEVQRRRGAEAPSTGNIAPVGRTAHERAFAAADSDGDGQLSKDEFLQYTLRRGGQYDIGGATEAEASASETSTAPPPSPQQLRRLAMKIGIPFVGFGFLDNAIMIAAGDQIEATFGVALGLSALAAAGLGNLISDVIGIQASTGIDALATRLGLPSSGLSAAQLTARTARGVTMLASMLGISIGCLLGMCPLLLMEDSKTKALRQTFAAIDTHKTGSIELSELEGYVAALGLDCSRNSLETLFSEIDSDRSRSLSFDEFKVLMHRWGEFGH